MLDPKWSAHSAIPSDFLEVRIHIICETQMVKMSNESCHLWKIQYPSRPEINLPILEGEI